jgi:hypothetical protein
MYAAESSCPLTSLLIIIEFDPNSFNFALVDPCTRPKFN